MQQIKQAINRETGQKIECQKLKMSCISQYRYFLGKGKTLFIYSNTHWVVTSTEFPGSSPGFHAQSLSHWPLTLTPPTYVSTRLLTRPHQWCTLPWVFKRYGKKLPFSRPPLSLLVLSSKQGCSSMAKCLPSECEDQGYVTPISYKSRGAITDLP